ncbi:endonuclease/exonuclease/phosphatase domain-containing protein [Neospora caninum Liverpool]|uniref:Endonuclease/exonuclease/phosphatase domain-containing protein n=1 Tax=Neospora caninum (strain Liverpool) TaxID=572307 RepID=F0VI82_NEOCL|nr:endonuclease/exonuclease/phosphatase domain-containing protein [Neospora caninum Liverpool]CBZ53443.1 endonuclease/exonuclease/phosphatase domain-containing protein [Neospora caninum Liverpool]CEL67430.1 TPA: endonuclease/exonuclease/phosphatase domain-containing protein, putative [Neospora caninum Liverpool]|eukprot:XP_003883475.1 endonuclease/exonuclease/phosphatase domain-containing protein [Neospora caninum Liverpool]
MIFVAYLLCLLFISRPAVEGGLPAPARTTSSPVSTLNPASFPQAKGRGNKRRGVSSASDMFLFFSTPRTRKTGKPNSISTPSLFCACAQLDRPTKRHSLRSEVAVSPPSSPQRRTLEKLHFISHFFTSSQRQGGLLQATGRSFVLPRGVGSVHVRGCSCVVERIARPCCVSGNWATEIALPRVLRCRANPPSRSFSSALYSLAALRPSCSSLPSSVHSRRVNDMAPLGGEGREGDRREPAKGKEAGAPSESTAEMRTEAANAESQSTQRNFVDELSEIRRLRAAKYREHKQHSEPATSASSSRPPSSFSTSSSRPPSFSSSSSAPVSFSSARRDCTASPCANEGARGSRETSAVSMRPTSVPDTPPGRSQEPFRGDRKLDDAVYLQGRSGRRERCSLREIQEEEEERARFSALACSLARAAREGDRREETGGRRPFEGPGRRLGEEQRERPGSRERSAGAPLGSLLRKRGREETRTPGDLAADKETRAEKALRPTARGPEGARERERTQKQETVKREKSAERNPAEAVETQEGNELPIWSSQFDVLTWNLDGLDEAALRVRTSAVISTVRALRPAVVMFQEVVAASLHLLSSHLAPLYHIYTPSSSLGDAASSLLYEMERAQQHALAAPSSGPSAPPLGCPYFCVLMLCKEQMLPLDVEQGALTEWFPGSQMGRHLLGIVAAPMSWPDDRLLFLTSHLESIKEYRDERLRQFRRCMQVVTRSFAHVCEEEGCTEGEAAGGGTRGERTERKARKSGDDGEDPPTALHPAFAAVFGGDTNLRDSELAEAEGDLARGRREKLSGARPKTESQEKQGAGRTSANSGSGRRLGEDEKGATPTVPRSVRDVWEVLGRPDECRYTWDMLRNDNKQMKWRPRLRFDRFYWWSPRPRSSTLQVRVATEGQRGKPGISPGAVTRSDSEVRASSSSSASLHRCERAKDEASHASSRAAEGKGPLTWAPQALRLVGVNRLPMCGRFPSDHFGLLARFRRGTVTDLR